MKLMTTLLLLSILQVSAEGYAQKLTMARQEASIRQIFKQIRKQTGFNVLWKSDMLDASSLVDARFNESPLENVMKTCLQGTGLTYTVDDKTIVIRRRRYPPPRLSSSKLHQQLQIRGTVTDSTGAPLPGVSVIIKGTNNGISTDIEGTYTLGNVDDNAILVFSMVGFETREVSVDGRSLIDIQLREAIGEMEEVIVVGYGTQKKQEVTAAISQISGDDIRETPATALQNSLTGKIPGLFTQQRSGQPGAAGAAEIFIRGVATFTSANKSPLILVDDVVYNAEQFFLIDPNEVESVSVLKDAASTAIYGIKGANGVILVTTRRGKAGKPVIRAKTQWAVQTPVHRLQPLDAYNTARLLNEALENDDLPVKFTEEDLESFRSGEDPYGHPNVDWNDVLFKNSSMISNNNVDISGGNDRIRYFVTAGYMFKDGILRDIDAREPRLIASQEADNINNNYYQKRYKFRSNVDIKATNTLDFQLNVAGTYNETNQPEVTGPISHVYEFEYLTPYMYPVYNPDGSFGYANPEWGEPRGSNNNIAGLIALGGYSRKLNDFMNVHLSGRQKLDGLTPGLSVTASIAYSAANEAQKNLRRAQQFPSFYYNPEDDTYSPRDINLFRIAPYTQSYSRGTPERRLNIQGAVNYQRDIGAHHMDGLVLFNQTSNTKGPKPPVNFRGYTFRFGYNFRQRYLFQLSGAYNGSSRFVTQKQYQLFPAASIGWNVANEPFFQEAFPFVDNLKIRSSLGWLGNDDLGLSEDSKDEYLYEDEYGRVGNYSFGETHNNFEGIEEGKQGNYDVAWETERKFDLGLDFSLFNGRISGSVDYFDNYRYDILTQRSTVPTYFGVQPTDLPPVNIGEVSNKGYEIELGGRTQIGKVGINIKGNYSFAKNKILYMDEPPAKYPWQKATGLPIGTQKQYLWEGAFYMNEEDIANSPTPAGEIQEGWLKYRDLNDDGIINIDDMAFVGHPNLPNTNIGLNLGLSYGGFSLSVLLQAALNFDVYTGFDMAVPFKTVPQPIHLGRWTPETAETATFPALTTTFAGTYMSPRGNPSTFWTVEGDYLRIRSAQLSYNFPKSLISKAGLSSLMLFANGYDLFTWSKVLEKYQFDPEIREGAAHFVYPSQRIVNFGLEVTF